MITPAVYIWGGKRRSGSLGNIRSSKGGYYLADNASDFIVTDDEWGLECYDTFIVGNKGEYLVGADGKALMIASPVTPSDRTAHCLPTEHIQNIPVYVPPTPPAPAPEIVYTYYESNLGLLCDNNGDYFYF